MDDLRKELNAVIGKIRAHREMLAEPHWILVDNRGGLVLRADWYKDAILKALEEVDVTLSLLVKEMR